VGLINDQPEEIVVMREEINKAKGKVFERPFDKLRATDKFKKRTHLK